MSKIDDILNKLNLKPFFSYDQQQEAKAQLLQLVLEVIGEDEAVQDDDGWFGGRNLMRKEQRQKAIKLFGKEQE